MAGIAKASLYRALKRAEAGEPAAIALRDAIENAEGAAEAGIVASWRKAVDAGPQYWAAAATFLERKSPERWGKRSDEGNAPKVVVQIGAGTSDVDVKVVSLTHTTSSPYASLTDTAHVSGSDINHLADQRPITPIMLTAAEGAEATAHSSQDTQDTATQSGDVSARTKPRRTAGGARRATPQGTRRAGRG